MTDLVVFCDGGSRGNPGPAAAGAVIEDSAGKRRFLCGKYLGEATNNQAEYAAVVLAYQTIKTNFPPGKSAIFYLDSQLVASQLSGLFKIKDARLGEIVITIRGLESWLSSVYYHHIPREKNKEADRLVNQSLDQRKDFQSIINF